MLTVPKKAEIILFMSLLVLVVFSIFILRPYITGDSISYINSVHYLKTGETAPGFMPNRIMTTFAPLFIIATLSNTPGGETALWLFMNIVFFVLAGYVFYRLLTHLFKSKRIALLGTLFFSGNYASITYGLHYLMDMGSWFFYVASMYFLFQYIESNRRRDLLLTSFLIGIGGIFKEYTLFAVIPVAIVLIYEHKTSIFNLIKNSITPALLATAPVAVVYFLVYKIFGYTYADWIKESYIYEYSSSVTLRIVEYIKSFGSLYNILGIFTLLGLAVFIKDFKTISPKVRLFIIAVTFSSLPLLFWGGITQRILFITVPAGILFACLYFKKYEKHFYWFLAPLGLYLVLNFLMDSFLLDFVNLPI